VPRTTRCRIRFDKRKRDRESRGGERNEKRENESYTDTARNGARQREEERNIDSR